MCSRVTNDPQRKVNESKVNGFEDLSPLIPGESHSFTREREREIENRGNRRIQTSLRMTNEISSEKEGNKKEKNDWRTTQHPIERDDRWGTNRRSRRWVDRGGGEVV